MPTSVTSQGESAIFEDGFRVDIREPKTYKEWIARDGLRHCVFGPVKLHNRDMSFARHCIWFQNLTKKNYIWYLSHRTEEDLAGQDPEFSEEDKVEQIELVNNTWANFECPPYRYELSFSQFEDLNGTASKVVGEAGGGAESIIGQTYDIDPTNIPGIITISSGGKQNGTGKLCYFNNNTNRKHSVTVCRPAYSLTQQKQREQLYMNGNQPNEPDAGGPEEDYLELDPYTHGAFEVYPDTWRLWILETVRDMNSGDTRFQGTGKYRKTIGKNRYVVVTTAVVTGGDVACLVCEAGTNGVEVVKARHNNVQWCDSKMARSRF